MLTQANINKPSTTRQQVGEILSDLAGLGHSTICATEAIVFQRVANGDKAKEFFPVITNTWLTVAICNLFAQILKGDAKKIGYKALYVLPAILAELAVYQQEGHVENASTMFMVATTFNWLLNTYEATQAIKQSHQNQQNYKAIALSNEVAINTAKTASIVTTLAQDGPGGVFKKLPGMTSASDYRAAMSASVTSAALGFFSAARHLKNLAVHTMDLVKSCKQPSEERAPLMNGSINP